MGKCQKKLSHTFLADLTLPGTRTSFEYKKMGDNYLAFSPFDNGVVHVKYGYG